MQELQQHLDHLRARNLRPTYINSRRTLLGRLESHLGHSPLDTTVEELRAFLNRGLAATTRATELAHLRSFYKWAVIQGLVERDPAIHLERPKLPVPHPRPIATSDLVAALAVAVEPIRTMLLLAAYAGLRCCEIAPLSAEHVLLRDSPPVLIVVESKGGGAGSVPISPLLADELWSIVPRSGWLFPRADGHGPLSANRVCQLIGRYLHGLGIGATAHQLRHWFATETYRATRDLRVTQKLMRHAKSSTTDRYTYVSDQEGVDAVALLPALT
jgi:integrase